MLGLGLASPARGANFSGATGLTGCVLNMADNGNHYVWYNALTSASQTALDATRSGQYDPTDLNTYDEDVLTTQTDVDAHDANYGGSTCNLTWMNGPGTAGMAGLVRCWYVVPSNSKCDQQHVDFDTDFMGPESAMNESWLACHEFGHTIGLKHTGSGANCMQFPGIGSPSLTSHDVQHINANY